MISPGTATCSNIWWVTKAWRLNKKVTAANNRKVGSSDRQTQPAGRINAGEMNEPLSPLVITVDDVPLAKQTTPGGSSWSAGGDSTMLYDLQCLTHFKICAQTNRHCCALLFINDFNLLPCSYSSELMLWMKIIIASYWLNIDLWHPNE